MPGLIASGLVLLLLSVQAWAPIERMVSNQMIRWRGAHTWDSRLIMISIDDKTIDRIRQFPISRDYYAELLTILDNPNEGSPNVVAFNVILSENIISDSPLLDLIPPNAAESGSSRTSGRSATAHMAEAMRRHGYVVVGQIWDLEGNVIEPAPSLSSAAIATGHLRLPFSQDGFTRSVEVFYRDVPSLGMAAVQAYSMNHELAPIPTNLNGFQINWPGPVSDLTTLSLVDVLSGAIPPDAFANKIIFVSYGATSGHTPVRSPFDNRVPVPGGYMHPAVVDNLLNRDWLRPISVQIVLLLLLFGGPLLSRVLFCWNWLIQLAIVVSMASIWFLACVIALQLNYLLPVITPIVVILGTYLFVIIWQRLQSNALLQVRLAFLNTVSHEIRTPLNAIANLSELLQETPLTDRQREYAETLHGSSQTLVALINDVLDLSKIESGRLTIEDYPVNVVEIVERSIELLASKAAAKNIELVYAIAPNVPALIRSDPVRLQQILSNLLSNAVKFTAVGEVSVRVRATPCRQACSRPALWRRLLAANPNWFHSTSTHQFANHTVQPRSREALYELCFEVKDTGIGIPATRIPHLFKPFRQVSLSTTRRYGGTGLGLSICKRLSERMGGDIWVKSTLRKGSQFFFTFNAQIAQATLLPPNYLAGLQRAHLLVVDANSTRREQLTHTLQAVGIRTLLAESLVEARTLMENTPILDGLILDETAVGVAAEPSSSLIALRSLSDGRQIPVIFMSALKSDLGTALENVVILWKPIKQSALYQALRSVQPPALNAAPNALTFRPAALLSRAALKILIAEDNRINQQVALRLLEILGYRADVVSTGIEVLAALQRQRYDVILMDMRMPEMDGVEVARKIRRMSYHKETWIIAMTANTMTSDRELCLSAGMDDYLCKPIEREALNSALERSPVLQQIALD